MKRTLGKFVFLFLIGLILGGVHPSLALSEQQAEDEMPFIYDDHGRRDPFWALVSPSGTVISYETDYTIMDLILEGIMSGEAETSIAIINGRVVRVGDSVGSFQVIKVSDNKVILKKDNQKFELRLKKEE